MTQLHIAAFEIDDNNSNFRWLLPIVRSQKGHNFGRHFAAKRRTIVWRRTFGIDKVTVGLLHDWRIIRVGKEPDLEKEKKMR